MRRAYNSELWIENGEFVGINLGADFTSEHEWGIKGIKSAFHMVEDEQVLGIARRMILNMPENLVYRNITIDKKKYYVLILIGYYSYEKYLNTPISEWLPADLKPYSDDDLICAWDERSFGILVFEKYKNEIETLYNAFQNKDIVIGIGGGHAFKNGGLKLSIISKLPKEIVDEIYNNDLDAINLKKAAEATGIYEILDKAGKGKFKGWMALSPRWKDDDKKEVIFWLNPEHQNIHQFGWYNVEDLKEWANDTGRVMQMDRY